jgi:methyl-accepting chemotaxis protein
MTTSELPLGPISLQLKAESKDGEKSAGNLGDLLDQVSKNSIGELDSLIGEIRRLRGKLQADGARIKRDIEEYAALSQQVMELTNIISDSVATLSNVTPATSGRTLPALHNPTTKQIPHS